MSEIKLGDVVRLKSGGPLMTVITIPDHGRRVTCQWFSVENCAYEGQFPLAGLNVVHRTPEPVVVSAGDCNIGVSS